LNTYLSYIFTKKTVIFSLCNLGLSPSERQAATTETLLPQEQCGKSLAVAALMHLIFTIAWQVFHEI